MAIDQSLNMQLGIFSTRTAKLFLDIKRDIFSWLEDIFKCKLVEICVDSLFYDRWINFGKKTNFRWMIWAIRKIKEKLRKYRLTQIFVSPVGTIWKMEKIFLLRCLPNSSNSNCWISKQRMFDAGIRKKRYTKIIVRYFFCILCTLWVQRRYQIKRTLRQSYKSN